MLARFSGVALARGSGEPHFDIARGAAWLLHLQAAIVSALMQRLQSSMGLIDLQVYEASRAARDADVWFA